MENIAEIYLYISGALHVINGILGNKQPRRPLLTLIDGSIMLIIASLGMPL